MPALRALETRSEENTTGPQDLGHLPLREEGVGDGAQEVLHNAVLLDGNTGCHSPEASHWRGREIGHGRQDLSLEVSPLDLGLWVPVCRGALCPHTFVLVNSYVDCGLRAEPC